MAIRFSKRVKIAPGINLNLSKSGVSTTVGPKNASLNVGKKGVHVNASVPQTGLSVRQRVGQRRRGRASEDSGGTFFGKLFLRLAVVGVFVTLAVWFFR
jgi:hypothetical protein